jgi:hypothetical protein
MFSKIQKQNKTFSSYVQSTCWIWSIWQAGRWGFLLLGHGKTVR